MSTGDSPIKFIQKRVADLAPHKILLLSGAGQS